MGVHLTQVGEIIADQKQIRGAFQRVTSSGAFIPEIDGLRFIAIASVVLFHLLAQLDRYYAIHVPTLLRHIVGNGDRGVRLFFVISGFILALPFAKHYLQGTGRVPLGRYFLRRLTRLEPPYILAMLGLAILDCWWTRNPPEDIVVHLLASVSYCHSLIFGQASSINPVAWSLEVEVQFYILVPWLTSIFAVRNTFLRRGVLAGTIVALGLVQVLIPSSGSGRFQLGIGYYLQFFLSGFLLADLFLSRQRPGNLGWRWDLVSLIGWPLAFLLSANGVQLVLPWLVLTLYWAALHGRVFNRFFQSSLITCTGGMCYTIYLLHFAVIAAVTRFVGHSRPLVMILLSLVTIAFISAAYFLLIEKPCMNPRWPSILLAKIRKKERPSLSAATLS
jgi:peptidoglycan/LPS O-acetylase OafA/YrhL